MEIQLNDVQKLVHVFDLDFNDLAEFNRQRSTIPDDYLVQFIPTVEDARVPELGLAGRNLYFTTRTVYETRSTGNGFVSHPSTVYDQFLSAVKAGE
jgi:hypothetical protein